MPFPKKSVKAAKQRELVKRIRRETADALLKPTQSQLEVLESGPPQQKKLDASDYKDSYDEPNEPIPPPAEVLIKNEPTEATFCLVELESVKSEENSCASDIEDDPIPQDTVLRTDSEVDEERCSFCLKTIEEDQKITLDPVREVMLRKKIEHVLSTTLGAMDPVCCRNCWRMFEVFHGFKTSCLMALTQPDQLLASALVPEVTITEVKPVPRFAASSSEAPQVVRGSLMACHLCPALFKNAQNLKYHLSRHNGEKSFQCRIEACDKAFFLPEKRTLHERTCQLTCKVCGTLHKSYSAYQYHMEMHNPPKYECNMCSNKFYQRIHLRTHWMKHFKTAPPESSEDFPLEAAEPNKPIIIPEALFEPNHVSVPEAGVAQANISVSVPDQITKASLIGTGEVDESLPADHPEAREDADWCKDAELPTIFFCHWCGKSFPTENIMRRHRKGCNSRKTPKKREHHQCPHCPAFFSGKYNFQCHVSEHNGEKIVQCRKEGCTKLFYDIKRRRVHEKSCGMNVQLVCTICGVTLKSDSSMRTHMDRHGEPRFACEVCGKSFCTKTNLKKHAAVHSDERKFECKVCGKKYKSREANRVHQRIHTQEKPYACSICNERFTYNCLLKAHREKGSCTAPGVEQLVMG